MGVKVGLVLLTVYLLVDASWGGIADSSLSSGEYWKSREEFLKSESKLMLGGDLVLEDWEEEANKVLMKAKCLEVDEAWQDPSKFLPSRSFLQVSDKIRESPVYKMIQSMPKGSILHAHGTAIASSEYLFTITYRPNLYICETEGNMKLKFFDKPNTEECDWKLLSDVRQVDKGIDTRIRSRLTMKTEYPELTYTTVDHAWDKFAAIFSFISPLLKYRPVYEDYFYQALKEFYEDNVQYLELRTSLSPLYELDGAKYDSVDVARVYRKVTKRFMKDHPDFVGVKLIYSPKRKISDIDLDKYLSTAYQLKKEFPDFIAGFDLVGQEEKGEPLMKFAEKLRSIGEDVKLFFHAGETNWYSTSTDENLVDAVLLNTKRIGHGFALLKHPKVMDMVRQKGIAIEVSPISNQVLALVKDLRNHPAAALFANNYPVVVSNDDPALWGAKGLSYDFYEAFVGIMSRNADIRALKKLALNSIEYSSMDEKQKLWARVVFDQRWKKFVTQLVESN